MENQAKHKKFWKPPSFEDFNIAFPNKKIKLDSEDVQEKPVPKIAEPTTLSELATHPKKIEEVKNWLKKNFSSKAPILFITGPAGCGKTTTLKVLANEEGILIKEWINPINKTENKAETIFQSDAYDKFSFIETSQTDKFEDFIFRSSRYNSLFEAGRTVLILVKDIPNIFIWRPKSFHDFLEKYKQHGKSPIVFIITDDQNLNLSSNLFPNHVKSKHNVSHIKFNPVNQSALMRILRTICDFYCPEKVSLQFVEEISKNCGGDLRSGISDLMLLLRLGDLDLSPKSKKSKRLRKDGVKIANQVLSLKNINFDFYHVLGRILYPKLLTEKEKPTCSNPNQFLLHDVRKIADSLGSSNLCTLHENYIETFTKLQDVVEGADCFSFCNKLDHHQELEPCICIVAVTSLMLKNTTPKKSGFKPIKKSFRFDKTTIDMNVDVPECFNNHLSKRDLLLDVIPFLKFLKINDEGSKVLIDVNEDCDEFEDVTEIEEFDD